MELVHTDEPVGDRKAPKFHGKSQRPSGWEPHSLIPLDQRHAPREKKLNACLFLDRLCFISWSWISYSVLLVFSNYSFEVKEELGGLLDENEDCHSHLIPPRQSTSTLTLPSRSESIFYGSSAIEITSSCM